MVYFVRGEESRRNVVQMVYFVRGLYRPQGRLYGVLCSRGGLLGWSLTLTN